MKTTGLFIGIVGALLGLGAGFETMALGWMHTDVGPISPLTGWFGLAIAVLSLAGFVALASADKHRVSSAGLLVAAGVLSLVFALLPPTRDRWLGLVSASIPLIAGGVMLAASKRSKQPVAD